MHGRYACDAVLITTVHAWQHQGKTLFISRKTYRIDGSGQMAITVDVEVASNTPHPARIGRPASWRR
ncbi:hypothetical protein [Enterobacter hormaechei]